MAVFRYDLSLPRVNVKQVLDRLLDEQPTVAASELARAAGVSRQAAHRHLRAAVQAGELSREGAGRSTRYRCAGERAVGVPMFRQRYAVAGLEEDRVWRALAAELPRLPDNVVDIMHYALTELVNNAIDHAAAEQVEVVVAVDAARLSLDVVDDGIGVYAHVAHELGLQSQLEAIEQLHKGKTTTMPDRHSGEGLFFVSKAADVFELDGGKLRWRIDNLRDDMAVIERDERRGTRAHMEIAVDSSRNLRSVFDAYTDDFRFSRTTTVVRLFEHGESFVSRSEAKRLLHGLDRFRLVELDFAGVRGVGQGFADEIFRVWQRAHPEVELRPIHMGEAVAFMVRRAMD